MKKTVKTHTLALSPTECSILAGFGEGFNEVSSLCKTIVTLEKKEEIRKILLEKPREFTERMNVVIPKRRMNVQRVQHQV